MILNSWQKYIKSMWKNVKEISSFIFDILVLKFYILISQLPTLTARHKIDTKMIGYYALYFLDQFAYVKKIQRWFL